MSLSEKMTGLMDAARNVTQLTGKLSISDLTSYLAGLAPINYLDNPIAEQTVETASGSWNTVLTSASLEEGTYFLSAKISSSESIVSLRLDFNGGVAQPLSSDESSHDWGFTGENWINPGGDEIGTMPFKVTTAGKFNFGLAGNPFTGGEAKVEKMMLNKGDLPLPFTKNKLGGSKARPNGFLPHYERGLSVCRLAAL
ncbi:hypothetical protein [Limosilactobacillus mucosae]|uniref:hypothetical protein n=1 Tax=Limosilactobacillus mucosae TaxID=97478 RepID=UPI0022E4674F|nr:hypothetical protein [Limosilactobacillus mucosae]